MGITLSCQRICMAEKPAHDLQAKPAGNEVRGMGMTVIVKAIIPEARMFGNTPPELLYTLQWFIWRVSGK